MITDVRTIEKRVTLLVINDRWQTKVFPASGTFFPSIGFWPIVEFCHLGGCRRCVVFCPALRQDSCSLLVWGEGNPMRVRCRLWAWMTRFTRQHHALTSWENTGRVGVFGTGNTRREGREIRGSSSLESTLCLDVLSCTVVFSFPYCLAVEPNDYLTQNHP